MKPLYIKQILIFIFVCCRILAYSQESPEQSSSDVNVEDFFKMSLEELLNIKVTTGSFLSLDLQNSPMSLTIITSDQLNASGARHLSEALEIYVPGFQYMINKWNGIIWGMRGVASDRNTKFIFLVNGQKQNMESRDGAMTELDLGLMDDIERIEVLRGPAGLMYGSGAIAGVINIITKQYLADNVTVSAKATTWSMDTYGQEGQVAVAHKLGDKATVSVDLGARRSEGVGAEHARLYGRPSFPYPQGRSNPPADGVPSNGSALSTPGNYKAGIDLQLDKLRIYTRLTHQVTNAGGWFMLDPWPEVDGAPTKDDSDRMVDGEMRSWDSFYASSESWGRNRRQYVLNNICSQATYSVPIGENELQFKGGFAGVTDRIQREETKSATNSASTERNTRILETFGERRYHLGATYRLNSKPKYLIATGLELNLFDIGNDLSGNNSQDEKANHHIVSNIKYLNGSAFSEGVYHITDQFDAIAGLRYDLHTRTIDFGGVFSPKLALMYSFSSNNTVKLVYQQSANNASADNYEYNRYLIGDNGEVFESYHFEDPTLHDNVIPPVNSEDLHKLKPERSQSIELMSYSRIGSFIIMPSVSYNTISDMFAWNQSLFRVVNAGRYSSINVDVDMQYSTNNITVGCNHTLQQLVGMDVSKQEYTEVAPVYNRNVYDSVLVGNVWNYTPRQLKTAGGQDSTQTIVYNSVRDGITVDGKNFINLSTHTTKIYADYKPAAWMTIHTSARIFWGLWGRKDIYEYDKRTNTNQSLKSVGYYLKNIKDYPFVGIHSSPNIKMNIGVTLGSKDDKLKVSLNVYDLLAGNGSHLSRNSLRWQDSFDITSNDLYAMDYRSYALKLTYSF